MLALALQELGHSILFTVTEKDRLHRPENLYPGLEKGYPDWILDLSYLSEWDFIALHPDLAEALSRLSRCDAFIMNSSGPSLLPFLKGPSIALLTGSDLYDYANYASLEVRSANWDLGYRQSPQGRIVLGILRDFVIRQRKGIQRSVAVRYFPRGSVPDGDRILDEMQIPDSRRHYFAIFNTQLDYRPPPKNDPIRIFCGARLTWKLPVEPGRSTLDYKGGDIMIRGLGLFYRETGMRFDIRLVRKGLHVKETEALVVGEGIADQVTWMNELSLSEYWQEIALADIIFDQLANSLPGAPAYDGMATGRPVIANPRDEVFEFEPSPICSAKTPEEVCKQLKRLVFSSEERGKIGRLGRRYVEQFLRPEQTARQIEKILWDAVEQLAGQNAVVELDYTHLLTTLANIRQVSIHEFEKITQELEHTHKTLKETRQALTDAHATIDRYARFLRPFRFLIKFLKMLPFVNNYIWEDLPRNS